jgi:hypothetical protein
MGYICDELTLVAAVGINREGNKHPLAVVEGAIENTQGAAGQPDQPWARSCHLPVSIRLPNQNLRRKSNERLGALGRPPLP